MSQSTLGTPHRTRISQGDLLRKYAYTHMQIQSTSFTYLRRTKSWVGRAVNEEGNLHASLRTAFRSRLENKTFRIFRARENL